MRYLLLVALLHASTAAGGEAADASSVLAIVADDHLMDGLAALVDRAAAVSAFKAEQAAFVVRDENGVLHLITWGTELTPLRTIYRGVVPPKLVVIVHTHPDRRRRPSDHDMREARRLKIPIWVLTRGGIWAADPNSDEPVMILNDPGWTRRAVRRVSAK